MTPVKKRAAKKRPASKKRASASNPLARVRDVCLALPEAHEVEAWGTSTFRVNNKLFAMYSAAGSHHSSGRPGLMDDVGASGAGFRDSLAS